MFSPEVKKGSAALLVLALVEERPRHGYEISKLIEQRSGGRLRFKVASLYPLLYRLEERGSRHPRARRLRRRREEALEVALTIDLIEALRIGMVLGIGPNSREGSCIDQELAAELADTEFRIRKPQNCPGSACGRKCQRGDPRIH